MSTVVIEHVKVSELPEAWREKLEIAGDAQVTVRIDPEAAQVAAAATGEATSAFGMWADYPEMKDVESYVRTARAGRPAAR